jgi:hypothetical protein
MCTISRIKTEDSSVRISGAHSNDGAAAGPGPQMEEIVVTVEAAYLRVVKRSFLGCWLVRDFRAHEVCEYVDCEECKPGNCEETDCRWSVALTRQGHLVMCQLGVTDPPVTFNFKVHRSLDAMRVFVPPSLFDAVAQELRQDCTFEL